MKKLAMTAALSCALAAGSAQAGSLADPILEKDMIEMEAANSSMSGTALVALLALTLMIPVLD